MVCSVGVGVVGGVCEWVAVADSGVEDGGVGLSLSLPLAVVGNGVVGIGVGRVDVGGSNGSDGGVGDHSDVVGASVLDRLGNVGSGGDLANGPGLSLKEIR